MDFTSYAQGAAVLVNAELEDLDSLRAMLESRPWLAERVGAKDLGPLRAAQSRLGALVDASAAGDGPGVVALLNDLLSAHPISPRVSGHDEGSWHLHVNDDNASVAETLVSEALLGLAILISESGPTRFGRCDADGCNAAYLDTSANNSRRFCSTRCATRTNVAALRRRRTERADELFGLG
ncbi:MAG: CGNR zinc finger domain-containing protein [Mycobacteriales bacterium]